MNVTIASKEYDTNQAVDCLRRFKIDAKSVSIGFDFAADVEAAPVNCDATFVLYFMDAEYAVQFVRAIRKRGCKCLLLVLLMGSKRVGYIHHVVDLLNFGADDVQPQLTFEEIAARIFALQRRAEGNPFPIVKIGNMAVSAQERKVWVGGEEIIFTGTEFAILNYLARFSGRVISTDAILDNVYSGRNEPASPVISQFICKIRKKLDRASSSAVIINYNGVGFALEPVTKECAA